MNTISNGNTRNSARNSKAVPINSRRTSFDSVKPREAGSPPVIARLDMAKLPAAPGLQPIDREQHHERHSQHDRGDDRRTAIVELLELDDDEERRDFRYAGNIACDEND